MNYIIVKHAHPSVQELYWEDNPQEGIDKNYSAADTYTGQQCNIKTSYVTRDEAEKDCEKMNQMNSSGWYAVCPVAY